LKTFESVSLALKLGYRLIDTASLYQNEVDVGEAVRRSQIPRGDLFITTKLWNSDQGYDSTLKAFDYSIKRLGLRYVDLYLIHWPVAEKRLESWRALEKLKNEERCRSIGVSNFTIRHLKELLDDCTIFPAVNQVEFSPFLYQKELLEFCQKHAITLEAYSPLTKGDRLGEPQLKNLAKKYGKTSAQILIRWNLQHQIIPLPKSNTPSRIQENSQVFDFEIQPEDMQLLDSLHEDFRTSWNPTQVP
jgi:diketogulonate reductase-like aldo/keto reductase